MSGGEFGSAGPKSTSCGRAGAGSFGEGKPRLPKGAQVSFADRKLRRKDGSLRTPPGRKAAKNAKVRHRPRPDHEERHPMHVTMRAVAGLPSFRSQVVWEAFDRAFRETRRGDFRIVEFSVQTNHVHMIVEATDARAIANGIKSFGVRANRLVNAALKRAGLRKTNRGRVWGDRYHRRDLTTPRAVRNALVYCINNYRKHGGPRDGGMRIDPCSSGRWFQGWIALREHDDGDRPTEKPEQPLLLYLWKRTGLIHPGEAPRLPS